MSTGSERVLEQFDRHLKKGDIFAAPRPGEPDVFGRRRPSASPAFVVFVQTTHATLSIELEIECEFNESGHDGGHGSTDL